VSTFFNLIWSTVKGFLQEHTKKKIHITKQPTCDELKSLFSPNQLEKRYGGEAPNFEGPWWPPQMPSKEVGVDQEKIVKEEDYEKFASERPSLRRRPEVMD
jgi:hypothetical protein